MELASIKHIEPEKLSDYKADLFVASLSHDKRCLVIPRKLENIRCRKIALFCQSCKRNQALDENRQYFEKEGFEIIPVETLVPDMGRLLQDHQGDELNLIFDCSSMSQNWYYEFFRWFDESQDVFERVRLRFVYTMAAYVMDDIPRKVKGVKEFLELENRKLKPKKALILGLGHEANVSEPIVKMEKPDLLFLFYSDPPVDKRFVEHVFVNNHKVITNTPIRNLVAYPINNGQEIYQSLINTILPIRNEYSITMIPQGPKIFSVASMLVHLGYPDTMISYPVYKRTHMSERIPCGKPVVLDICFEGDE